MKPVVPLEPKADSNAAKDVAVIFAVFCNIASNSTFTVSVDEVELISALS